MDDRAFSEVTAPLEKTCSEPRNRKEMSYYPFALGQVGYYRIKSDESKGF